MTGNQDVTELLIDWQRGNPAALDQLLPIVYTELHRLARAQLRREQAGHSLQATALVHDVYLRLLNVNRLTLEGRAHFLAVAARLMRQILVDHARRKRSSKRGGDVSIVNIDVVSAPTAPTNIDILALDNALNEMASFDPRQRDLVELKFFAGLTIDETAAALGVSSATVEREWALAKAWLHQRLGG